MRRREREHRPDPVKPAEGRVFVEYARLVHVDPHTKQVVDRVGIFLAAEPIVGHPAAGRHAGRLARRELA